MLLLTRMLKVKTGRRRNCGQSQRSKKQLGIRVRGQKKRSFVSSFLFFFLPNFVLRLRKTANGRIIRFPRAMVVVSVLLIINGITTLQHHVQSAMMRTNTEIFGEFRSL